jgi:hypothetical protein
MDAGCCARPSNDKPATIALMQMNETRFII